MKANQAYKAPETVNALNAGAGIGATIGFVIGIIVVLTLLPTVQDQAAAAEENPNASSAETGLVGLYPLVFVALPLATAASGAGIGSAYGRK